MWPSLSLPPASALRTARDGAARPAGLCLPPTRWQSPSAQGPGLCPPGAAPVSPPSSHPPFELKPYTLGAVHPLPQEEKLVFKLLFLLWGRPLPGPPGPRLGNVSSARASASPTCGARPHLGSCHTKGLPHLPVWCCAQSPVSPTQRFLPGWLQAPASPGPGPRPLCPGATATIQPDTLPVPPPLGPCREPPPQTLQTVSVLPAQRGGPDRKA